MWNVFGIVINVILNVLVVKGENNFMRRGC